MKSRPTSDCFPILYYALTIAFWIHPTAYFFLASCIRVDEITPPQLMSDAARLVAKTFRMLV